MIVKERQETANSPTVKYFDLSDEEKTRFKEICEELKIIFNADKIDIDAIKEPPVGIRPKCDYEIRIHNGDSIDYIFNEDKKVMTIKDHIENLDYIMDSMPDDACGDWRDSIAYAIENLKEKMNNGDTIDQMNNGDTIDQRKKDFIEFCQKEGYASESELNKALKILDKYKKVTLKDQIEKENTKLDDNDLDFAKVYDKISVPLELIESIKTVEVLEKMKAEIKKWYFDADVQSIAKDPCVVDAMIDLYIRTVNKYKENEVNKIKSIKDPTQSDIKERIMNREKYINDASYREGYDDGRKEGANSVVTNIMDFLNILSIQIEYMKKTLTDTTNGEEGSKE